MIKIIRACSIQRIIYMFKRWFLLIKMVLIKWVSAGVFNDHFKLICVYLNEGVKVRETTTKKYWLNNSTILGDIIDIYSPRFFIYDPPVQFVPETQPYKLHWRTINESLSTVKIWNTRQRLRYYYYVWGVDIANIPTGLIKYGDQEISAMY